MQKKHLQKRERGVPKSCSKQLVPKRDCQKRENSVLRCNLKRRGAFKKRPKGVLKTGFVWYVQKLIRKVKVVKNGFNVWNANSGLMKLAHLVKKATFVIIVDLTFFGA